MITYAPRDERSPKSPRWFLEFHECPAEIRIQTLADGPRAHELPERTMKGRRMKFNDVCFLDVETTGLDPRVHELLQVGVVRVSLDFFRDVRISGVEWIEQTERSVFILPEHIETADPAALAVNGYDPEKHRARNAVPLADALDTLAPFFERTIIAGHNVAFDWSFIAAAFERCGRVLPKVDHHRIDTASLAFPYVLTGSIESLSLRDVAKALEVPVYTLPHHDALEDATTAMRVVQKFVGLHNLRSLREG